MARNIDLTSATFARNRGLANLAQETKMSRGKTNMKNLLKIIALLGAISQTVPVWASAGTEGASFLDIPVGAGPAALGSAYTALATNAYAPVWNPAGLGMLNGNEA